MSTDNAGDWRAGRTIEGGGLAIDWLARRKSALRCV